MTSNKLFPYQKEGVKWLASRQRAYLADGCGLGKTAQAVVAATQLDVQRPVVICPASARPVWRSHWAEYGAPSTASRLRVFSYTEYAAGEKFLMEPPDLLILDEAHYAKSMFADRTRRALRLARSVPRVWYLSGTPEPNHPGELYPVLRATWPDLLREHGINNYDDYTAMFCKVRKGRWGPKVYGAKNEDFLRELLGTLMLRRDWPDVSDQFPPLRYDHVPLNVTPAHVAAYQEAVSKMEWSDELDRVVGNEEQDAKLARFLGGVKSVLVGEVLKEELTAGAYDKVVIMAYHLDVLDYLEQHLEEFGVVRYDGSTTELQRVKAVADFQNAPGVRVFIGQIRAAGMAITLTAAHEIVLVEQMWSPMDNHQAVKRIHRIGQDSPCRARVFSLPGTLDVPQQRSLVNKLNMIEATLPEKEEVNHAN